MQAIYTGVGMEERRVVHGRARCERGGAARLYGMTLAACGRWRARAGGPRAMFTQSTPSILAAVAGMRPAFREKPCSRNSPIPLLPGRRAWPCCCRLRLPGAGRRAGPGLGLRRPAGDRDAAAGRGGARAALRPLPRWQHQLGTSVNCEELMRRGQGPVILYGAEPAYDPCRDGRIHWGRPVDCEALFRGRRALPPVIRY